jgi:hypothetical protein
MNDLWVFNTSTLVWRFMGGTPETTHFPATFGGSGRYLF